MAEHMIQRACKRFAEEVSCEDAKKIQSTANLDAVKLAVVQIEKKLAARQSLRNIARIRPFLDSVQQYSKALGVVCNGTNYLPWIWTPIQLTLVAVHEHGNALDTILNAYADIGSRMPRFSRFGEETFPDNAGFRQLVAFLFEDIVEFHRKVYAWISKPAWKIFFSSQWGRFGRRFSDILDSVARTSEQIDREGAALDIIQATESRRSLLESTMDYERHQKTQQLQAVLNWLEARDSVQDEKFQWLEGRRFEGTSQWALKSPKIKSWLQREHGSSVLWLNGKPGSGKSVLAAQIISYLRTETHRHVCFFFCDFQSPSWGIVAHVLRYFCAQLVQKLPDAAPYIYDECLANAQKPTAENMKRILPQLFSQAKNLSLVIDGVDEVSHSEHKNLIKELLNIAKSQMDTKLLIVSQDLPSISSQLRRLPRLSMSEEKQSIQSDMALIVTSAMENLQKLHEGAIPQKSLDDVKNGIIDRAEGMHLWVHLVLQLLGHASNTYDLQKQLENLPTGLKDAYKRILQNILSRCSTPDKGRIRHLLAWLIAKRGKLPLAKHMIRLGMTLCHESPRVLPLTRPFPNATDICKPLVEDGPGASLIFVHSTVPEFLLDDSSGPFLTLNACESIVSFACLSQLCQSFDLSEVSVSLSDKVVSVASGFYALLPYAYQHWIYHLRAWTEASTQEVPSDTEDMQAQIMDLAKRIEASGSVPIDSPRDVEMDKFEHKLLEFLPPNLARTICSFSGKNSDKATPLSAIMDQYIDFTRYLLGKISIDGLDDAELLAFKEEYGPTAFICRWSACDRSIMGFSSKSSLATHELSHSQPLKCYQPDCNYNDIGFPNEKSLKTHTRKRHRAPELNMVPKRVKKCTKTAPTIDSKLEQESGPTLPLVNVSVEDVATLRKLENEEEQKVNPDHHRPVFKTSQEHEEMEMQIILCSQHMKKIRGYLDRWYALTHDSSRARMFFRMREWLELQFIQDNVKAVLTLDRGDLAKMRHLMGGIYNDMHRSVQD